MMKKLIAVISCCAILFLWSLSNEYVHIAWNHSKDLVHFMSEGGMNMYYSKFEPRVQTSLFEVSVFLNGFIIILAIIIIIWLAFYEKTKENNYQKINKYLIELLLEDD